MSARVKSSASARIAAKRAIAKPTAVSDRPHAMEAATVNAKKPRENAAHGHVHATETEATAEDDASHTLTGFMACALLMETEAAQRYGELADAMETHNNREVADLFRRMAEIEGRHAQKIVAAMNWHEVPVLPQGLLNWAGFEAPETTPVEEVHYLMQPYQALQLALAGEQRAEQFFARLVRIAKRASVRKAARELRDEEREHVALVKAWMDKMDKPAADWADDPDPPRYTD